MIRKLLMIPAVLLALLTIAAAYGGMVSPERFQALPAILFLAFPYIAMLTVAVCVVWFFFSRKVGCMMLFALLICTPTLRAYFPLHFWITAPNDSPRFTLMTFNVFEFKDYSGADNRDGAITTVLQSRPDIVAFQEYVDHVGVMGKTQTKSAVADSLCAIYPYRLAAGDTEQAVMSRWPLTRREVKDISDVDCLFDAYDIEIPGLAKPLTLINVHMRSLFLTKSDKQLYMRLTNGQSTSDDEIRHSLLTKLRLAFVARAEEARQINRIVNEVIGDDPDKCVIVCGDFNDTPLSYAQRVVMGNELADAYTDAALGPAITYHDNRFFFRIDQILYSKHNLKPLKCRCIKSPYSDHYPLIVEMAVEPQPDRK